jgi:LPXTG-site transpeptidase (sortase) family protein
MKRIKRILTAALTLAICAGLAAPSYAYNYDFESGGESLSGFGRPTSTGEPVAGDPLSANVRRNKDAAALPPPYGVFSGNIPTDQSSLYHDNLSESGFIVGEQLPSGSAAGNQTTGGGGFDSPTSVYPPSSEYPYYPSYPYTPSESDGTPALTAGSAERTSATGATVRFYSTKAGRYYYTVVADGAAVPTISTSGTGTYCAAGWTTLDITVSTGAKDFYVRVKDADGRVSAALKIDVDVDYYNDGSPVLMAGTASRTNATGATVQFFSNKAGRYYYTVVADGAAVPTMSTSGTGTYCAAGWTTLDITVSTGAKDFYVRVKDADGRVSAALKIDVPAYYSTPVYTAPSYYADGSIGTLYVPRANKNLKVYEGETLENMKKGIGHFASTSAWDGNVGFAGHNRGAAAYFSFVKDLAIGDTLIYATPYGSRTYEIYRKDVIAETDFSALYYSAANILTLITCVENVPEQRYCVQAQEI